MSETAEFEREAQRLGERYYVVRGVDDLEWIFNTPAARGKE